MTFVYGLVEYITSFIEVFILLSLYGWLFQKKRLDKKQRIMKIVFAFGVMLLTVFLNSLQLYSYTTAAVWIPLVSLLSVVLYRNRYLALLCAAVVFVVIINAMDFLAISVLELIFNFKGITLEVMTSTGPYRCIFVLTMKIILVIGSILLMRKKHNYLIFDTKTYLILMVASVFCFFCMQYLIEAVVIGNVADMRRAVLVAWVFIILFVVSFVLVFRGNLRLSLERLSKSIVATRLETLEEDNKNLNDAYSEIAKLTHDFKNHMRAMTLLAQNKNYDELTNYLKDISSDVGNIQILSYTGIDSVDAVINNKRTLADKKGILFDIDAAPLYNLRIRSMDLCAVIVNLLDNAIEANMRLSEDKKREVYFSISAIHSMVMIKTINNCNDTVTLGLEKGELETNKENRHLHGYGLHIVKTLVEKYDGTFDMKCENGKFISAVMLSNDN